MSQLLLRIDKHRQGTPERLDGELIVDEFAGGGGASTGIEDALGRAVDIAVNHDPHSIRMHETNHPNTTHYCQDVWSVDPVKVCAGRPVGLAWFSPDCKDFSKAKGGRPVSKRVRGLAWVVVRWAQKVRPRVIILENVEEFTGWGPLDEETSKRIPEREGEYFDIWVNRLRTFGYDVEWKELRAADYGVPTIRKRLFLVARCDGQPIRWPEKTHAPRKIAEEKGLKPWRSAAEIIDWSLPCHSIFLNREEGRAVGVRRPLAEKTMARIARGVKRFVIDAAEPFIVTCNHGGDHFRGQSTQDPMCTVTAARDAHGVVIPYTVPRYGERPGQAPRTRDIEEPMATVTPTQNGAALVAAFLAKHFTGMTGTDLRNPMPTVTTKGIQNTVVAANLMKYHGAKGDESRCNDPDEPLRTLDTQNRHALVSSNLVKLRGTCKDGQSVEDPMPALTAGGTHVAEVRAFMLKYFGTATGHSLHEPTHTARCKPHLGLVTVMVGGEPHVIVDIGMRMLTPRELARAHDFPEDYVLSGTKSQQVAKIGNSVPPPMARVMVEANMLRPGQARLAM